MPKNKLELLDWFINSPALGKIKTDILNSLEKYDAIFLNGNNEDNSQLKSIIKNSKVKLIQVDNELQLRRFIKQNAFGDKIYIGMGAGSISNWMRELPRLM